MIEAMNSTVLVDGNNVMGSRPDGWWRNRAGTGPGARARRPRQVA